MVVKASTCTGWVVEPALVGLVTHASGRAMEAPSSIRGNACSARGVSQPCAWRSARANAVCLTAKKRQGPPQKSDAGAEDSAESSSVEEKAQGFQPRGLTMSKQVDEYGFVRPQPGADSSLPEIVANRMGKRMIVLFSVPFFTGIGGFVTVYLLSIKSDIVVLPSLVATSTLGTFGLALTGLTYGIMSASWDPDEEGSFWGFTEFKTNLLRTVEALSLQKKREKAQSRDE
ncbi:Protein PAM68, chloroplastic [Porphyridium purpureum]|uniref:Protein PAM68, chloroplastic n=1 Tax=Porphyridium purpureum TaxID=35688 RepID=A0A5J4YY98_PORPP|nr:Protein PAM68, chloroplastic [Porphyridium purpureum]|eukprot:POR8449..scf209_3